MTNYCRIISCIISIILITVIVALFILNCIYDNERIIRITDVLEVPILGFTLAYQIWQHRQEYMRSTFYKSLDILQSIKHSIKIQANQMNENKEYINTVIGNKFFEYSYDEIKHIEECLLSKEYDGHIKDNDIEGVLYKIQTCFDRCSTDGEDKSIAVDFQNEQYALLHHKFINRKYDITYECWSKQQILEQEACRIFCKKYHDVISPYIVNIETILELIDISSCCKCVIKDRFVRILQSTLSSHEKKFLELYIVTYSDKNISKLSKKYELLN